MSDAPALLTFLSAVKIVGSRANQPFLRSPRKRPKRIDRAFSRVSLRAETMSSGDARNCRPAEAHVMRSDPSQAFELFGSRPEAMPEPLIVEMVDADRER